MTAGGFSLTAAGPGFMAREGSARVAIAREGRGKNCPQRRAPKYSPRSSFAFCRCDALLVPEISMAIAIHSHGVVQVNDPIVAQTPKLVEHFGRSIFVLEADNNQFVHE
jgi:hypothetical protein